MENKYEKVNEIVGSGTFRKDKTWQRKKSLIENSRKLKMKKTKRIRKRINKELTPKKKTEFNDFPEITAWKIFNKELILV